MTKLQGESWREENREAIDAYNEHVTRYGVFSTGLRASDVENRRFEIISAIDMLVTEPLKKATITP